MVSSMLSDFIHECGFDHMRDVLEAEYRRHLENHKADHASSSAGLGAVGDLERRWYSSLTAGTPDYSVYDDPFYLCDLWLCWRLYSRKGVLDATNPAQNPHASIYSGMSVLDLGCGLGLTSALLRERISPERIVGTNLASSFQYQVACTLGRRHGFNVAETSLDLGHFDVLLASEYFEHVEAPIEHLHELLDANSPSYVICANGFNGRAIGHFSHYQYNRIRYSAAETSRLFNHELSRRGFDRVKTRIWNNRPAVWCYSGMPRLGKIHPGLF